MKPLFFGIASTYWGRRFQIPGAAELKDSLYIDRQTYRPYVENVGSVSEVIDMHAEPNEQRYLLV
jgi:hypothetical protein